MGRKLAILSLTATVGWSAPLFGLGMGDIDTGSSLNERLTARIPLLSVGETDLSNIKVSLASPEAFERAGMERPFYLSRLDFEVRRGNNGATFVEVTTAEPVKEPFLDFLVEVRWPQGRLMREYTVLLDPPIYNDDPSQPPAAPAETAVADSGSAGQETGAGGAASSAPSAPSAVGTVRDRTPPQAGADDDAATYGPVSADDTLYAIANQVRPEGVSANQAMMALLRANPDAFMGGNINRMKRGAVLRVPDRDAMTTLGRAEALAAVREQMASWRQGTAVAAAGDGGPEPSDGGAAENAASVGDAAEERGQLKVVAPDESSGGEASASLAEGEVAPTAENVERLQSRVTMLEESNASLESENADLREQLQAIRRELAEKEAALNIQMEQPVGAGGEDGGDAVAGTGADAATAGDEAADEASAGETGAASSEGVVVAEGPDGSAADADNTAPAGAADDEPAGGADAMAASEEPAAAASETDTAASAETPGDDAEPASTSTAGGLWASVKDLAAAASERVVANARWLGLAAGGVLVLLLGAMMVMRRRRAAVDEEPMPDSMAPAGAATPVAEPEPTPAPAAAPAAEADPIDRAETLRAAGEAVRAQEVLDLALGEDPDNKELRYKLLEILAERGDRGGFEAEAQVLHTQLDSESDPLWQRTVALGREIAPEHPLFGGRQPDADEAPNAMARPGPTAEPEQRTGAMDEVAVPTAGDDDTAFDLDFELDDTADDAPAASEPAAAADRGGFDFDVDMTERDRSDAGETVRESQADDAFDFELDTEFEATTAERPTAARDDDTAEDDALGGLDFELPDDLEFSGGEDERAGGATASTAESDDDASLDFEGFSFDGAAEGDDDDLDDFDDLDEISTKLDLARAYLDMGDADGAKGLLEEVVQEGDSNQKEEAEGLLKRAG